MVFREQDRLATNGEFVWPVRAYYEDTDSGGVVYYANYLKFMERARTEWLRAMGYEQFGLVGDEGLVFAVRRVELDYFRPARLDDLLQVNVQVLRYGRASIDLIQTVRREPDDEVLCQGRVKIASLDAAAFKPRVLPSGMLDDIRQYILNTGTPLDK